MRSLLITTAFPPQTGGIQTVLFEIVSRWRPDDITVMTQAASGDDQFDRTCSFETKRQPLAGWQRILFLLVNRGLSPLAAECLVYFKPAIQLFRHQEIDVIQCGHVRVGLVALLLKSWFKVPFVIYTHAQEVIIPAVSAWQPLDRILRGLVLRQADLVFANSEYTRQKVIEWGGDSQKVIKIPFGVSLQKFTPVSQPITRIGSLDLRNKQVLLTVGRLVKRKGHDMVIKALPEVIKYFPNVIYLIAGDGPMLVELRDMVEGYQLNNYVKFIGEIPDTVPYYQACDIFIMTSRAREQAGDVEGFGLVFLEANACGKSVIGGRSGGVPDAVLDGVTGLLVDPTEPDDIATAILKLLTDKTYAHQLGKNGRRRVEQEKNWDHTVVFVQNILHGLIDCSE